MTEFALNATIFAFIKLFAFIINYDFESQMSYDSSNLNDVVSKKRLSMSRFRVNHSVRWSVSRRISKRD
jgi:hypothetical protein